MMMFILSTGRVIIVTSVKGRIYYPCISAYGVTKHGLETFSDCLRVEMERFGVKVSLVEPGNFSTCTDIVKGNNVRESWIKILSFEWRIVTEECSMFKNVVWREKFSVRFFNFYYSTKGCWGIEIQCGKPQTWKSRRLMGRSISLRNMRDLLIWRHRTPTVTLCLMQ